MLDDGAADGETGDYHGDTDFDDRPDLGGVVGVGDVFEINLDNGGDAKDADDYVTKNNWLPPFFFFCLDCCVFLLEKWTTGDGELTICQ